VEWNAQDDGYVHVSFFLNGVIVATSASAVQSTFCML
jgi:hypothetical protein